MRKFRLPHPIPYQGSKRNLAPLIGRHVPKHIETWYEPFAGSAAMTIWAAHNNVATFYIIGDSLVPITELWRSIIFDPLQTSERYTELWNGQSSGDLRYFNRIRDRYNQDKDPIDLLYLICRCVKNAVRFNSNGNFTQSVDKRRLGMRPVKMKSAIFGVSNLLNGRVEVQTGDWLDTITNVTDRDFIYMDPPYLGTSIGRDKRYAEQMKADRLVGGLRSLRNRRIRFALSYDGMTGKKVYGPPLPDDLSLRRLFLRAGISSQATLNGQGKVETIESLYLSPGVGSEISDPCPAQGSIQSRLAV